MGFMIFKKKLGKVDDYRTGPEFTIMTLFLLSGHRPGSVVCHQQALPFSKTEPSKILPYPLHFKELNEPASSSEQRDECHVIAAYG